MEEEVNYFILENSIESTADDKQDAQSIEKKKRDRNDADTATVIDATTTDVAEDASTKEYNIVFKEAASTAVVTSSDAPRNEEYY